MGSSLSEFLLTNASEIRFGIFASLILIFALFESMFPRRERLLSRGFRWVNNFSLSFLNTLLLKIVFPLGAVGLAFQVEKEEFGLFTVFVLPYWVEFLVTFLILDFCIYLQHRIFHKVSWLWKLHRVHHADIDLDVSSGIRFHPIEIILSMMIKMVLIVAFGISPLVVLVFEVVLNATSLFNHSSLNLPLGFDRLLRKILVTPDMHRVHHSVNKQETDSNFGFNFSCWDYLLGTYCAQPQDGHKDMQIGVEEFRKRNDNLLHKLLIQPFLKP
jgi:sterol desaturase/sphingolipid hydroxylase (fatty acid hydroxylase superfamily)